MITTSVKLSGSVAGFGVNSASLFRQVQMKKLGDFAIETVKARVRAGIGSDDGQLPLLSAKKSAVYRDGKFLRQRVAYAEWKAKHGLKPIRDMVGTGQKGGHMLDNLSVRIATENLMRASFTQNDARKKARANERRTPFLGFSPKDEEKIVEYARQIFKAQVQSIKLLKA